MAQPGGFFLTLDAHAQKPLVERRWTNPSGQASTTSITSFLPDRVGFTRFARKQRSLPK
jgi:hypothetical protein